MTADRDRAEPGTARYREITALRRDEAEWLSLGSPDTFQEGVPKSVNVTLAVRFCRLL